MKCALNSKMNVINCSVWGTVGDVETRIFRGAIKDWLLTVSIIQKERAVCVCKV